MSISTSDSDREITKRAIEAREGNQMHYVIFISPMSGKPMYTAKMDGDFTITDPRCCMNPIDGSPDIVCNLWVHVSELYFDAMVKAGYITNNLRIVLHCTIHNTYTFKVAINSTKKEDEHLDPFNAREIQERIKSKGGLHSPDLLSKGYRLIPLSDPTKKNQNSPGMGFMEDSYHMYRSKTLTSAQFRALTKAMMHQYQCDVKMANEERARDIAAQMRPMTNRSTCSENAKIPAVPTLVVEGDWGLKADFPNQPIFPLMSFNSDNN